MFERFDHHARQVTVLSQEQARRCNHPFIGTEHVLLALLKCSDGEAAKVLTDYGLDVEKVESALLAFWPTGDLHPEGTLPFTSQTKAMLEQTLREALALGHNYIGSEHMLLALTGMRFCLGSLALTTLGADLGALRESALSLIHANEAAGRVPHSPMPSFP